MLKSLRTDIQDALFFGPHSNDLAYGRLQVEGLVALYRANARHIATTVFTRLWTDSDISKIMAVKACIRMRDEGDRLSWHPSLSSLRNDVAPQIRTMLKVACVPQRAIHEL